MCLLSYYRPHVMPAEEDLRNGAKINPHGSGYAIQTRHHIIRRRGLDAESVIAEFMDMRRRHMASPAVFHSRYASASPVTLANVQPVRAGKGSDLVVAHNGYLFTGDPGDERSDTQIFAEDMLPRWDLDSPADRKELAELIAPGKAVILRTGHAPVILNKHLGAHGPAPDGSGTYYEGVWHSNFDFTGTVSRPEGICPLCRRASEPRICMQCQEAAVPLRARLERRGLAVQ